MRRVGYADALIARETADGLELIDGHLRAGLDPEQQVPVLVTDLDEHEAATVLATLDPLAGMAETDDDALTALLDEIIAEGDEALKDLVGEIHDLPAEPEDVDADAIVEPPANPITQRGDLWVLGRHRLLCGDSSVQEDVHRLLGGSRPALTVTDPPYGVDYTPGWRNEMIGRSQSRRIAKIQADGNAAARALLGGVLAHAPGDVLYVWHASLFPPDVIIVEAGFKMRSRIAWVKQSMSLSRGHYHWRHEECAYAVREGKTATWAGGTDQTTVWEIARPIGWKRHVEDSDHPTPKPVECMERPIRNHRGDVYDPFLGSGSTMIAAERVGRTCFGMEIEPRYVDASVKRWEALTGEKAARVEP